jgi:hypothetical protein
MYKTCLEGFQMVVASLSPICVEARAFDDSSLFRRKFLYLLGPTLAYVYVLRCIVCVALTGYQRYYRDLAFSSELVHGGWVSSWLYSNPADGAPVLPGSNQDVNFYRTRAGTMSRKTKQPSTFSLDLSRALRTKRLET